MNIVTAGPIATSSSRSRSDHRAEDDIEIAVKLDVARPDEGVVEAADLLVSHMWPRADRVFDPAVGGEQPHPGGAVVRGSRLRRPLYRGQQMRPIQWHHHHELLRRHRQLDAGGAHLLKRPAAGSAATAAVRSSSTLVANPARAASSAVRRTQ